MYGERGWGRVGLATPLHWLAVSLEGLPRLPAQMSYQAVSRSCTAASMGRERKRRKYAAVAVTVAVAMVVVVVAVAVAVVVVLVVVVVAVAVAVAGA